MNHEVILRCTQVEDARLPRLRLELRAGMFLLLRGDPVKTRLALRILGLLEEPGQGWIGLPDSVENDPAARVDFRNRYFAFLFDAPGLLPAFSVVENIAMPFLKLSQHETREAGDRTERLLEFVGLPAQAAELPASALSLFDQHRVAVARALINGPVVLFVERAPDGLTPEEMPAFARLLRRVAGEQGCAVVACDEREALRQEADFIYDLETGETSTTFAR